VTAQSFILEFDGDPVGEPESTGDEWIYDGDEERPRRRWLKRLVLGLLLMIVVAVCWGIYRYQSITFIDVPGVEPAADGTTANWLLVGTDTRDELDPNNPKTGSFDEQGVIGKRADTIMVVRVDKATGQVNLLSIPRDLWLPIAEVNGSLGGEGRVNGAFNGDDGRQRLVATVEANLSLEINHYTEVNFVGFQELVDAVGGVTICFDGPSRDSSSGLAIDSAGCQVLAGDQALAYVRARKVETFIDGEWKADLTADFGRTARQRNFLSQVASATSDSLGPTSVRSVDRLMAVAGDHLLIEDGASMSDMVELALDFSNAGGDGVVGHTLPVDDFKTSGGAAVLKLRENEAEATLDLFRN